jgi:uncharacterized surface protein with fasciclin (FAS1) repeats
MMKNVFETAQQAGNLKTLVSAIEKAGLADTLKGPGPYTVFAPTDEAFAKVPKAQLDELLQDKEQLKQVLLFHCVPGKIKSTDVQKMQDGTKVRTASQKEFTLGLKGGVKVNDAMVTKTDIEASNGIIHIIDRVIMPK